MNKGLGDKVKREEVEEDMGGMIWMKWDNDKEVKRRSIGKKDDLDVSDKNVGCVMFLAEMWAQLSHYEHAHIILAGL